MATRAEAEKVADKLTEYPRVRGVELFGSVLKKGTGHDIDLVVLVEKEVARQWWSDMSEALKVKMGTWLQPLRRVIKDFLPWLDELGQRERKQRRLARASELLSVDLEALGGGIVLDIFLLPEDWRIGNSLNLALLQDIVENVRHRKTRMFLESIASEVAPL